jgi:hypothetical protein
MHHAGLSTPLVELAGAGEERRRKDGGRAVQLHQIDLDPQGCLGVLQVDLLLVGSEALLAHLDDHELSVRQFDWRTQRKHADHLAVADEFSPGRTHDLEGRCVGTEGSRDDQGCREERAANDLAAKDQGRVSGESGW